MLALAEVEALTDAMSEGRRGLASWGGLRRGEILGLHRRDVNEVAGGVAIERSLHELHTGEVVSGPPKSKAGARFVHLPRPAMATLAAHLDFHVAGRPQAPLFSSTTGGPMCPRFLESEWRRARRLVGLEDVRIHALRHFHLAITQGATTGS